MIKFSGHGNLYAMLLVDALLVVICFYLAYLFRFEFEISPNELDAFARTLPYVVVVKISVFALFHLYTRDVALYE